MTTLQNEKTSGHMLLGLLYRRKVLADTTTACSHLDYIKWVINSGLGAGAGGDTLGETRFAPDYQLRRGVSAPAGSCHVSEVTGWSGQI